MIDSAAENPPPLSEPLEERMPRSLYALLEDLWERHFHTKEGFNVLPPYFYTTYDVEWCQIGLTLEHLYKNGFINNVAELFDSAGRLRKDLSRQAVDRLINEKLLKGIKIGVIGGAEGRVFAEMGADVVNFDKNLKLIPPLNLPNLTEIPKKFNGKDATDYWENFDLTYSHDLFDFGSSLVPSESTEEYKGHLVTILWSTKEGGISVHNGNWMSNIVNNSLCEVKEVAPIYKDNRIGFDSKVSSRSTDIHVLKKLRYMSSLYLNNLFLHHRFDNILRHFFVV